MREKLTIIMAPDYNGNVYAKAVYAKRPSLATLWQLFRTRTQEAEANAKEHRLYEGGQHSRIPEHTINNIYRDHQIQEEPGL